MAGRAGAAGDDVTYAERALYLPDAGGGTGTGTGALVLGDLHVGRGAASNVDYPLGEGADLRERLTALLARFDPAEVVVAGDLLHAFDRVPEGVPETVASLQAAVADAGADLIVTPGNHDTMLDAVLADVDARVVPAYHLPGTDTVVCHGHEEPDADSDPDGAAARYLVGHEHPAVEMEGRRRPCFLEGPALYEGRDVVVLPAFSRLAAGVLVNDRTTADCVTPLVTDVGACRPVVVSEGEALRFPPLRDLRPML
jgi:hypothetical protein